jgi:Transmembrane secretion effector
LATNEEKDLAQRSPAGLMSPLRVPRFRNLLIADLVSDIGTFMQNVGAAWLMVSLHAGPGMSL